MKEKTEVNLGQESPLKWPHGQERTLIDRRIERNSWKKSFFQTRERLTKQLEKMGIKEALITFNPPPSDRKDPGVALYFALPMKEDYSWQAALGIDNPNPTKEEINTAFKVKSRQHHPDLVAGGSGGDVKLYQVLDDHKRRALAWVEGVISHDYCIAVDRCKESQWNLEAIRRLLIATATMEEYGNPGTLERTFRGFKTALPQYATEVKDAVAVGR